MIVYALLLCTNLVGYSYMEKVKNMTPIIANKKYYNNYSALLQFNLPNCHTWWSHSLSSKGVCKTGLECVKTYLKLIGFFNFFGVTIGGLNNNSALRKLPAFE